MSGDRGIFVFILGAVFALGVLAGFIGTDLAWRGDCNSLGMTRSAGYVYECHKKEAK